MKLSYPAILKIIPVALFAMALTATAAAQPSAADATTTTTTAEPAPVLPSKVAPFARLIGGSWKIGGLRHEFTWGINRNSVIVKSFDGTGLAAEARWFWNPLEDTLKGYSVDRSGAGFADMTTRFEGDTMINHLRTPGEAGAVNNYIGKWVFVDADTYEWELYQEIDGAEKLLMGMTGTRTRDAE